MPLLEPFDLRSLVFLRKVTGVDITRCAELNPDLLACKIIH